MSKIVCLTPDAGMVILSHSLMYVMHRAFIDAGVIPCCCLFIVGAPSKLKTPYAAFQTQLYNRDDGIKSPKGLKGTLAGVEALLFQQDDCVVVLDDLFPTENKETKDKLEKNLLGIARIIGNNSGRVKMKGNKVENKEPTCGVLFTGEYNIGSGSDAVRLLSINIETPIDSAKFKELNDGLLYNHESKGDCLWVMRKNLIKKIQKEIPTADSEDVIRYLETHNAAKLCVQIGGKYIGGTRFDAIKRGVLGI